MRRRYYLRRSPPLQCQIRPVGRYLWRWRRPRSHRRAAGIPRHGPPRDRHRRRLQAKTRLRLGRGALHRRDQTRRRVHYFRSHEINRRLGRLGGDCVHGEQQGVRAGGRFPEVRRNAGVRGHARGRAAANRQELPAETGVQAGNDRGGGGGKPAGCDGDDGLRGERDCADALPGGEDGEVDRGELEVEARET